MKFAIYLVFRQLAEWGYPHKKGIRRTRIVDEPTFFTAVSNTIQILMGLGARFPEIGNVLLKEVSDGQDTNPTVNSLGSRAEAKIKMFGAQRPWNSIMAVTTAPSDTLVPITPDPTGYIAWDALIRDETLIHIIGTLPAQGLVYGLRNSQIVNEAFSDVLKIGELFGAQAFDFAQFDELCKAYVDLYDASRNEQT